MYKVIWFLATAILLICLFFFVLAFLSHSASSNLIGIRNGSLNECPTSPNCVCSDISEKKDSPAKISPFSLKPQPHPLEWERLSSAIVLAGGKIETRSEDYLHATFRSRFFQFVDDLELRREGLVVHVRSASRVGHSDLGANRKRVEAIKENLKAGGEEKD